MLHRGGEHPTNHITTHPFPFSIDHGFSNASDEFNEVFASSMVIGNDVWIGANVSILRGSIIGDGSIVGAGSVVTHSVPPYSIVVGNPARLLRKRFDEYTIELLLKSQWWNWDYDLINLHLDLFRCEMTNDIAKKIFEISEDNKNLYR